MVYLSDVERWESEKRAAGVEGRPVDESLNPYTKAVEVTEDGETVTTVEDELSKPVTFVNQNVHGEPTVEDVSQPNHGVVNDVIETPVVVEETPVDETPVVTDPLTDPATTEPFTTEPPTTPSE